MISVWLLFFEMGCFNHQPVIHSNHEYVFELDASTILHQICLQKLLWESVYGMCVWNVAGFLLTPFGMK